MTATGPRAVVVRERASASFLDRVRKEIALTGAAAVDNVPPLAKMFGLARRSHINIDGYVDIKAADRLIRTCHLIEDAQGNVTLRVTDIDSAPPCDVDHSGWRACTCAFETSRCLPSVSAGSSVLSLHCRCQPLEVAVEGHPIPNDVFEHGFVCSGILDLRLGEGEGATVIAGPCGDQD